MRSHTTDDATFVERRISEHADVVAHPDQLSVSEITHCVALALLTGSSIADAESAVRQAKTLIEAGRQSAYARHHRTHSV